MSGMTSPGMSKRKVFDSRLPDMENKRDMSWLREEYPSEPVIAPDPETPETESQMWARKRKEHHDWWSETLSGASSAKWGNLVESLADAMWNGVTNGRAEAVAAAMCAIQLKRIADALEGRDEKTGHPLG